ncbi:MAG: DUF2442 domain-containing protein [Tepidiformaceae bacterium]
MGTKPYPPEIIVRTVEYVGDYTIRVAFADGYVRDVDLTDELHGEVFEPLKDLTLFSQVVFDCEGETAVWPNGADLAPEFLRWGPHKAQGCGCGYDDPPETDAPPH